MNPFRFGEGEVGGWIELGRVSGSRAVGASISVTSLANVRYYMILAFTEGTSTFTTDVRLNADSGSNYAIRQSVDGASDATYTSQDNMNFDGTGSATPKFGVGYISNLSAQEKLYQSNVVQRNTAGAGTAPTRAIFTGKWANTSEVIDEIGLLNRGSGASSAGELVVLGWSPDISGSNFWEELASVELGSANATIDSGTITAKKYLWFQVYCAGSTANNRCHIRMNSLSTGIYSDRYSTNGSADSTDINSGSARISNINDLLPKFVNGFIVNNSSSEKLGIASEVSQNTAGAGTSPQRTESVFKIATNDLVTSIQIINLSGNWSAGSVLTVWGSD